MTLDSFGIREGALEANFHHQQMIEFKTLARRRAVQF